MKERRGMTYFQFIHAVEGKVKEKVDGNISVYIHPTVKNNGTKRHGLTIAEKGAISFPPSIWRSIISSFSQEALWKILREIF